MLKNQLINQLDSVAAIKNISAIWLFSAINKTSLRHKILDAIRKSVVTIREEGVVYRLQGGTTIRQHVTDRGETALALFTLRSDQCPHICGSLSALVCYSNDFRRQPVRR